MGPFYHNANNSGDHHGVDRRKSALAAPLYAYQAPTQVLHEPKFERLKSSNFVSSKETKDLDS